jgi:signal transduction histidine kinase
MPDQEAIKPMQPEHHTIDSPILLVDDEEGIRRVLGIALADMGYQILTAENGEEALALFARHQPAIVLTDIKMPGMDGLQLLKTIKRENPTTEVIMITGHGDLELAIESLKFDATDFITKPINDDVLKIALKRARERIAMRRQLAAYTENLETLVEEKTRSLVEAERMAAIGRTVAGLSHSIKNIAGGLKGGAFVLEKGLELEDKAYLHQGWQMLRGNIEKITQLSLDLLNYAKTASVSRRLCDPNEPAADVVSLLDPRARQLGIALQLELSGDLTPFYFDSEAIHRALLNLVVNAVDAFDSTVKPAGGKRIVVASKCRSGGGVEYQVTDNGCGMADDTLSRIFQEFYTTKGTRGTGIGLMMTRNIVEKHGGEITARSRPGQGAVFKVSLPGRTAP